MGEQGDRRFRPHHRARAAVGTPRGRRRALSAVAMLVMLGALAGPVVPAGLSPAAGAGGSCAAADLKPSLRELMVSQGLPSYSTLVRGKDALVRVFLSKPECASKTQSVTVTGVSVAVANGTTALGTGSLFSPTGTITLPVFYTGAPPVNSPTDPILTIKGDVLTPCGASASCPTNTAGFNATFNVTLTYTATGVTGSQTVTFSGGQAGGAEVQRAARPRGAHGRRHAAKQQPVLHGRRRGRPAGHEHAVAHLAGAVQREPR